MGNEHGQREKENKNEKENGNELTHRARVQVNFCSHFFHFLVRFGRSPFPFPSFIIILKTELT